eukprot:jgi/Orpsp1_1/1178674/evm.model.c7180000066294.1
MKTSIVLSLITALTAKVSASCFSEKLGYSCCSGDVVIYIDADGKWGNENGEWCGIEEKTTSCWATKLGYPCCTSSQPEVVYIDENGNWGVENDNWCGIEKKEISNCWAAKLGYPCCTSSHPKVVYTDENGDWGVENDNWCGIIPEPDPCCAIPTRKNPFANVEFYLNPYYVAEVEDAIEQMTDASLIAKAEKMKNYSNAIWLDTINNMLHWLERNLKGALAQQNYSDKKVLTVFVIYALPGRDCHAFASNCELLANDSDMQRYKNEYIDVIEEHLKKYKSQPVVLIIEPDSLANLVTYVESTPACAESKPYYLEGHAYLIKKFGILPHVAMYLDIGHAFWLGWDDYREEAAKIYAKVIQSGSPGKIYGFADNVANYTPWEDPTLSRGPETEWNPCPDEKRYLQAIYKDFKAAGIESVYFVSDTSRNGQKINRTQPDDWCNQTGVGAGYRPQANPVEDMDYLDAFYWIKPLGESDGTSDERNPRYDPNCDSSTSMKPAPLASNWFQKYFEEGIKNANPPL